MLRRCTGIAPADFAATYWGRAPLLSRVVGRTFDDLLTLDAADELLSQRGVRTPFIRIAKDGDVVEPRRYTRSGGAGALVADQVGDDRVLDLFADGHTVVLQGLHRLWPALVALAGDLAGELGHPVQVNAYISPPASRGFAAHYDVHDVFVLQVAGRKRWLVHEPVLADPLPSQPWQQRRADVGARAAEPPLLDEVLEPGDVLYLPRGYLHAADALGEVSMHLTVGVHPVTGYDVAEAALALAADDRELRRSLPVGGVGQHADAVTAALRAAVDRLEVTPAPALAHAVRVRAARGTRPAPIGPIATAAAVAALDATTAVVLRRNLRAAVGGSLTDVELVLPDRTVRLPARTRAAVACVLDGGVVRASDLPGLTEDESVDVVRRLLREGVVVPAR
ncbi:MAG TPA: cupin domain-containing protein [Mycobacteriales bacterium]|nr:cupin domain-containing protein [Mycobacteriales bacterium]